MHVLVNYLILNPPILFLVTWSLTHQQKINENKIVHVKGSCPRSIFCLNPRWWLRARFLTKWKFSFIVQSFLSNRSQSSIYKIKVLLVIYPFEGGCSMNWGHMFDSCIAWHFGFLNNTPSWVLISLRNFLSQFQPIIKCILVGT